MRALQELNPSATTASNAQILFLVLNASSLTLLPVSIFMYRAQQGAGDPTLVFLPILLATSASTLVGLLSVAVMQRLRLWDPVVLAYLVPGALLLGGFMAVLAGLSATALAALSSLLGNLVLFGLILSFVFVGALKKVPVYETFVDGAKEGFDVAKSLLPYLVAMLCAVGVLRASGALEFGLDGIRMLVEWAGLDTRFVDALPTALVKPFSGSAARAMLIETMQSQGVDSFPRWWRPPSRAAPRPPSTCSRCTSAPSASSAPAMPWAAPCWPTCPASSPRSWCATGSSADAGSAIPG